MIYEFRHIPNFGIWRNSIFKAGLWGLMGRFAPRRSEARPQNQADEGSGRADCFCRLKARE